MKVLDECVLGRRRARLVGYLHDPTDEVPARDIRPCVVFFPGGGYRFLSAREAEPPAMAFFAKGYNTFVLYYSTAEYAGRGEPLGMEPLAEAALCVQKIRENSARWHIDPQKIALCGFSAGAHCAASLGVLWDTPELGQCAGVRGEAVRPDAMLLCYPVVSMGEQGHRGSIYNLTGDRADLLHYFSLEKRAGPGTAPAFIWHTLDDDTVPVENSLLLAGALRRAGVPFEYHLYEYGGVHGLSLCNQEVRTPNSRCATWLYLALSWLGNRFGFGE